MDTTEALSVGQTGWAVRRWKLYLIANGLDGLAIVHHCLQPNIRL